MLVVDWISFSYMDEMTERKKIIKKDKHINTVEFLKLSTNIRKQKLLFHNISDVMRYETETEENRSTNSSMWSAEPGKRETVMWLPVGKTFQAKSNVSC